MYAYRMFIKILTDPLLCTTFMVITVHRENQFTSAQFNVHTVTQQFS